MGELRIGLIGGTGLGQAFASGDFHGTRHEVSTPFGQPSDAVVETSVGGQTVLLLNRHGPGHLINPSAIPARANIFALKMLGCTHIIASGAIGSLRENIHPGELVIADQLIDRTVARKATFFENAAVHVEFADPFCPMLRRLLLDAVAKVGEPALSVHPRGCYVCMEGPAFSTRAESHMHRAWGGDVIGMTALPEAKLAREAEIPYALVALATDYDCWRHAPDRENIDPAELLKEIFANLKTATENALRLVRAALSLAASRQAELMTAPAREALKLAIWSDKARLPAAELERLAPLWKRHF
jgi:5'-methylthioadenosine phosphorylase